MEAPPHVILGKTQTDQDWIDGEVEAGVAACQFPRPGPRPAALDAPPATRQVAAASVVKAKPKAKRKLLTRVRETVWPAARAEPVVIAPVPAVMPVAPPADVPEPPPPPPPKPRDPVDVLLNPASIPNIRRVN